MSRIIAVPLAVVLLAALVVAAPVPKVLAPSVGETNTSALVKQHKEKLKVEASTEWRGYPVDRLIDEKPETVWYSASGDSPMTGKTPTVTVTFPEDVRIKRVTVLGSRDPSNKDGYFVLIGSIELLDKDAKVIDSHELKGTGDNFDFDLILKRYITVRSVRFKMTRDQEKFNCVALSEIQVE
jgi:hypothetical protein